MKWIKISERLPDKDQNCLIYNDGSMSAGTFDGYMGFWLDGGGIKHTQYDGHTIVETADVRYWMPIEEMFAPMYHVLIATPTSTTKQWLDKPYPQPFFEYKPLKDIAIEPIKNLEDSWTVNLKDNECECDDDFDCVEHRDTRSTEEKALGLAQELRDISGISEDLRG